MAIQLINVGETANDTTGDSLRTAFLKCNANFTELYNVTATGMRPWVFTETDYVAFNGDRILVDTSTGEVTITLPSDPVQGDWVQIADAWNFSVNNLVIQSLRTVEGFAEDIRIDIRGLFIEFIFGETTWKILTSLGVQGPPGPPGSVEEGRAYNISVTGDDSTVLVDGMTNTINLDGTIRGDVVPDQDSQYDLGSLNLQWKSLYVSNNTIYLGGRPLSLVGDTLAIGSADGSSISYAATQDYVDTAIGDGLAQSGNTGDVTFNGVKIIGAGTASGDGAGYSTLELVPDNDLYNNNQYLVIDPTYPTHIHIRAGGTQDASTAELYLGAENNHVRVRDGLGVKLQNDLFTTNFYNFQQGVDYDTATWNTDESGNTWLDIYITDPMNPTRPSGPFDVPFYSFTQFPQNRIEVFDGTNYTDLIGNGQAYTLGNQYQLRIGITQAPATNPTAISSLTFRVDTLTQSALSLENNTFDLSVNQDAYIYADQTIQLTTGVGNFKITTDDNNSSYSWYFTAQGYLQFPQGLGPTTSKGKDGDEAGSVVVDSDYIYYCHTDYSDGVADIWKRIQWGNDTW